MSARLRKSVTRQWHKWGLKRRHMLVLACLAEHINERDGDTWSFPGLALICEETGFSRRWVQIALHDLASFGAFTVDSLVGGRSKPICYYFHIDANNQVFLEFPPASRAEQPTEEEEEAQPAAPAPVPWDQRPLEEQLRYVRAIVNKRTRLGDDRRNYWQRELERIEAGIAARDGTDQAPESSGEEEEVDQAQEEEPPVTLEECQEEIAAWQERADYYHHRRDDSEEYSPEWKGWQDRLFQAVDALYQWKQLAREREAALIPAVALSPPETPSPGAYA